MTQPAPGAAGYTHVRCRDLLPAPDISAPRIALYMSSFGAGGIKRVMLHLAAGFLHRGYQVDLLVDSFKGPYIEHIPPGVRVIELGKGNSLQSRWFVLRGTPARLWPLVLRSVIFSPKGVRGSLVNLVYYLKMQAPECLIAARPAMNLAALWAQKVAQVTTKVTVSEHNTLSVQVKTNLKKGIKVRSLPQLLGAMYPQAHAIVAVSHGVADDLASTAGVCRESITTIYNPVVTPQLAELAQGACPHPWLADQSDMPVILGAGRLNPQKNFSLLLRAFASVRQQRPARLIIMGEGPQRPELEKLAHDLKVAEDVALSGYVANPYAAFARANLFVLSSDYEGLPTVLIEALACGCPVVSIDCPSGPREILADGCYGDLPPVGDAKAMADAVTRTLEAPCSADMLRQRADFFSLEASVKGYLRLLFNDDHG